MIPKYIRIPNADFKTVMLVPAKASALFDEDDIQAIEESILEANANLYGRHTVWVELTEANVGTHVIKLTVHKSKCNELKNIGYHLKGISQYIKKYFPDTCYKFKAGNRVFHYIEI